MSTNDRIVDYDQMLLKFDAYLNKHRIFRNDKNILIPYSNTGTFTILLNLFESCLKKNATPSRINLYCLLIESDIHNDHAELCRIKNDFLMKEKEFGFKGYTVSLIDFFLKEQLLIKSSKTNETRVNSSEELWKLTNTTIEKDVLLKLQYKIIFSAAKALNCTTVAFSDCAVNSASDIMSNIILGRNNIIPFKSYSCKKNMKIQVLHPMHIFNVNTIIQYLIDDIDYERYKSISKYELEGQIQKISKDFILKLNSIDNVITILCELSNKLNIDSNFSSDTYCKLCYQSINEFNPSTVATESAKYFSAAVSKIGNPLAITKVSQSEEKSCNDSQVLSNIYFDVSTTNRNSLLNFKKICSSMNLCYSCITTFMKYKKLVCEIDISCNSV